MVIYKIFVFGADRKSNMAARVHNVFSLVEILKIFLSQLYKPATIMTGIKTQWPVTVTNNIIHKWHAQLDFYSASSLSPRIDMSHYKLFQLKYHKDTQNMKDIMH